MRTPLHLLRGFAAAIVLLATLLGAGAPLAGAQYGQVSGLFVITSPSDPNRADFSGLGCQGGQEVVLYMPGIPPRASDPSASTSVPGRILAVTTSASNADPLLNGTFVFDDVLLPLDLAPGLYEVHARCGSLDLVVLVRIGVNGVVVVQPDDEVVADIQNPTGSLPITGRSSRPLIGLGVSAVLIGMLLLAGSSARDSGVRPQQVTSTRS